MTPVIYNGIDFTALVDELLRARPPRPDRRRRSVKSWEARQMRRLRFRYGWSDQDLAEQFEVRIDAVQRVVGRCASGEHGRMERSA